MASDKPELPKGWEWKGKAKAFRKLAWISLTIERKGFSEWSYSVGGIFGSGAEDAPRAARAAEAAVVEWAEKLIREVRGDAPRSDS